MLLTVAARCTPLRCVVLVSLLGCISGDPGEAPRITEQPADELVARGQPVTLHCRASGQPPPEVRWFRHGQPLSADPGPGPQRYFFHGSSLYFVEVTQNRRHDDAGVYWCLASNEHGVARSRNATLAVAVLREQFGAEPRDLQVAQSEPARLTCDPPPGQPPPEVTWERNGHLLDLTGSDRLRVLPRGDLVIQGVRHHDQGAYTCVARSVAGERRSRPARLTVHVKPFLLRRVPSVGTSVSRRAELPCRVSGDPPPAVVWRRVGAELPVGRVHVTDDKSLRIEDVRLGDDGEYVCRAENDVGSVTTAVRLNVTAPPVITSRSTIAECDVTEPVILACNVEGRPPPLLYWLREGSPHPLTPSARFSMGANGSLVLSRPRPGDQGYYVCGAVSAVGSDQLRMELLLRSEPAAPLPQARQQARHLLQRRPEMRLSARPLVAGCKLVWSTAGSATSAVDGFYLRFRAAGEADAALKTVVVADREAKSHRLTGLRNFTEYEIFVSPFFRGVEGLASPLVSFRTPSTAPSEAPRSVTAHIMNTTSVLLQWDPPLEKGHNGIIIGYRLLLLSGNSRIGSNFSLGDTRPARLLTDLLPDAKYQVRISAVNDAGIGPYTDPVHFTTSTELAEDGGDVPSHLPQQAWFVALLGCLVFTAVALLTGLLYVKRQHAVKHALTATPGKQRHQPVWMERGWRSEDLDVDCGMAEQKLLEFQRLPSEHSIQQQNRYQQQREHVEEYAELDQTREDGPYASACVIPQNPLSRQSHAGSLQFPTRSDSGGGHERRDFPTMPSGARRLPHNHSGLQLHGHPEMKLVNRPSLNSIIPPPSNQPSPDHRSFNGSLQHQNYGFGGCWSPGQRPYHSAGTSHYQQCGSQCIECCCSEGESSYDNHPCEASEGRRPQTEPCQRRRLQIKAEDDGDVCYGIPACGGKFGGTSSRLLVDNVAVKSSEHFGSDDRNALGGAASNGTSRLRRPVPLRPNIVPVHKQA